MSGQSTDAVNVNINALGNYTMEVTNSEGCSTTSNIISITDSSNGKLFVYPNPSNGNFQVRYLSNINDLSPRKLVIYDAKGSLVYSARFVMFGAYTSMNIDLGDKGSGIYFIHLLDNDGKNLNTDKISIYR